MQSDERRVRKRPMRIRYTNRFKCLMCYLITFALPLVWQTCALGWIYPYKLASTAPQLPFALIPAQDGSYWAQLTAREQNWLAFLALCALAAWCAVLLVQLLWRVTRRTRTHGARSTQRAVRSYRFVMLVVWAAAIGFGWLTWRVGVSLIPGRTHWDYLAYFGFYALLPFAAVIVSRLAAPAVISGKHAFFKRL